jgi:hypothetical protein
MIHRLRPGSVEGKLVTPVAEVEQLLKTNDFAPAWVERMAAIAYNVPTRQDAVNSYMLHIIDDDKFMDMLQDVGYTSESALFFMELYKRKRTLRDNQKAGYPTVRMLSRQYAQCLITEDMFQDTVSKIAEDDEQMLNAVDAAKMSREVFLRGQTIKSVVMEYKRGLIGDAEAAQMLAERDIDPSCVPSLIKQWRQQRNKQSKYLTAAQLCTMREHGIIGAQEQMNALIRSNWSPTDAARIADDCTASLSAKEVKKADAQIKAIKREAEKAAKEAAKAARLAECGPAPCPANRKSSTDKTKESP